MRRAGVRGGAYVGGDDAECDTGLHLSLRVLARDDGPARPRGGVFWLPGGAPAGRRLDALDQEARGRGAARDGGVLLRSDGHGLVTMRLLALATVGTLALPVALAGQDVGLPLGTQAPPLTAVDLDGNPVALGQ